MMIINRLTDYATLLICEMVNNGENFASAKYLSKRTKISEATTTKVLKMLVRNGLLKSYRGHTGGYRLKESPSKIRIFDIITAIEGDISLTLCGMDNSCKYNAGCKVKHGWNKLNNILMQALQDFTLKDFVDDKTNFQLKKIG